MHSRIHALPIAMTLAFAGCTDDADSNDAGANDSGADSTGGMGLDEAAIIAFAADYEQNLTQVNVDPSTSQHGLAASVNFFVSPSALATYQMYDPEMPTLVPLAEGTYLVKEHLDPDGNEDGFLMMYKAAEGYNPDAADWFWARVDGAGATRETGVVGFCVSCHTQVADAGFVFGVPLDNRL